jgi:hypothetical protein
MLLNPRNFFRTKEEYRCNLSKETENEKTAEINEVKVVGLEKQLVSLAQSWPINHVFFPFWKIKRMRLRLALKKEN